MKGTTKWFQNQKGHGFITGDDGKDYFVHFTNIQMDGFKRLSEGQVVTFDVESTPKGQMAINVIPE